MNRVSLMAACVAVALCPALHAQTVSVQLVSQAYNNPNRAENATAPKISADGQTVVFSSTSSDIVGAADTYTSPDPFAPDVFAYDVPCNQAEIISTTWDNLERPDGPSGALMSASVSHYVGVSGDGRFVAFTSEAKNLVYGEREGELPQESPGPRLDTTNIFLVDRNAPIGNIGRVVRVSRASNGGYANGSSLHPSVSADGRYVTFTSRASNLVANDTNNLDDVFVYDIATRTVARASLDLQDENANNTSNYPQISADGSRILFSSSATDLINQEVFGTTAPHLYLTDPYSTPDPLDGRNILLDRNRLKGGVIADSGISDLALSGNAGVAAFVSQATNLGIGSAGPLPQVFVRSVAVTNSLTLIKQNPVTGPGPIQSMQPSLDHTGDYIAFRSFTFSWQPGDPPSGIYRRAVAGGTPLLLSQGLSGQPANGTSSFPSISADAARTAFESGGTNLVSGVTYTGTSVYLANVGTPATPSCTRF